MKTLFLLFLSILPVLLIGYYLYKKDKNKEPKGLLILLFILGSICCIGVVIISLFLEFIPIFSIDLDKLSFMGKFFNIFIGVALIEEMSKWIVLYTISYNHKEFDELYDMIIYSCFVSLGFACFENIFYVLEGGISIGVFRAFLAVPGHTWDAIFMGQYLGIAKICHVNGRKDLERKNIILSILIPILLHGIYDFCLCLGSYFALFIFLAFVIFMYIISIKKVKKISKIDSRILNKNKYCSNCGSIVDGNYCYKCGNKY